MAATSSYLQYLPPVLWQDEDPDVFSLGGMLRIFEKLLTGIDDGTAPDLTSIREEIDRLHELFDPWTTPEEMLPYLASWLALELPDLWTPYQRRKLTSEIVGIYPQRGRRRGLRSFLGLWAVAEQQTRPRIAVDDGSRILSARLEPERVALLDTLVGQGPPLRERPYGESPAAAPAQILTSGLLAPRCLARTPDGDLIVGDEGMIFGAGVLAGVWRISSTGGAVFSGSPPRPTPLQVTRPGGGWSPRLPVGLVVQSPANPTASTPWTLWVLDAVASGTEPALLELKATSPDANAFTVGRTLTRTALHVSAPVALALATNGKLYVLDRPSGAVNAKLVEVTITTPTLTASAARTITNVAEPTAMLARADGNLLVADAHATSSPVPGDLVIVDPATGTGTRQLNGLAAADNPLVAPLGLVSDGPDDHVLVVDKGLRPYKLSSVPTTFARDSGVYRVDLTAKTFTPVAEPGILVDPRALLRDGDTLYVGDRGEYSDPQYGAPHRRIWRAREAEFGVLVHFADHSTANERARRRTIGDVYATVAREKPAHSIDVFVYQI